MKLERTESADTRPSANTSPGGEGKGELSRGANVGRYVVLSTLGMGGMGVVYAAYDPELDRKVALKLMKPHADGGGSSAGRTRLVREAQALAKLSHPNVVTIYDVGTLDEQVWIAMEFISGQTLGGWCQSQPRSWAEILDVLLDVGRGVAAAHAAGFVHRDLKPDNVMIGSDGRVRVMDFGLAHGRVLAPDEVAIASTIASDTKARPEIAALGLRLTQAGAVQGTPAYMSPEQWLGRDSTPAADQFGWSVIAWEALFGELPFEGATMMQIAAMVLAGKRKSPPSGRVVPAWVRAVIERGLAVEPQGRWPSMSALMRKVESLRARRRVFRVVVSAGASILVLVGGIAGIATWLRARDAEERGARIEALIGPSEMHIAAADESMATMRRRDVDAWARFDEKDRIGGETAWSEARDAGRSALTSYNEAIHNLELALDVDPEREDVRARLADALLARAHLMEAVGDDALVSETIERLRVVDRSGERLARWNDPGSIRVGTDPEGAAVNIAPYLKGPDGRLTLGPASDLGRSPTMVAAVTPGSYLVTASLPGRVDVRYPLLVRRNEEYVVNVEMLASVPDGYVYVPAGRFIVGSSGDPDLRRAFYESVPAHEIWIDSFFVSKSEVTYGDYLKYLNSLPEEERQRRRPRADGGAEGSFEVHESSEGDWVLEWVRGDEKLQAASGATIHYEARGVNDYVSWGLAPVGGIAVDDVIAFSGWLDSTGQVRGARLCTENEWERAARGADERVYPHGDVLLLDDANFDSTYGGSLRAMGPDEVGTHPASRSPFGLDDMAGNVFEWTTSSFGEGYVARGGSFFYNSMTARAVNRASLPPDFRSPMLGVRVCASVPRSPSNSG